MDEKAFRNQPSKPSLRDFSKIEWSREGESFQLNGESFSSAEGVASLEEVQKKGSNGQCT